MFDPVRDAIGWLWGHVADAFSGVANAIYSVVVWILDLLYDYWLGGIEWLMLKMLWRFVPQQWVDYVESLDWSWLDPYLALAHYLLPLNAIVAILVVRYKILFSFWIGKWAVKVIRGA